MYAAVVGPLHSDHQRHQRHHHVSVLDGLTVTTVRRLVGPSLELISEHSVPFHAFPQAASVCTRQCAARQLSNGIETHLVAILVNTVAICNKSSENLAQNYE